MTEFREKLLSQSVISRRSGDRVIRDTKTHKTVRDENGHDVTTRDTGQDVNINISAPVRGTFRTEFS